MALSTGAALGVFAAASAVSTVAGIRQQKDIQKAQEQQQAVDIAAQNERSSRARRATIKEAMVKRAQIENVAGTTGQTESSAAIASGQAVTAGESQNIGQINTALALSSAATAAQSKLNIAQQTSPLQAVAGVTQQAAIAFKS